MIAGLGLMGARALSQVDQDLRIMYTEYTLGATDLAHISADIMRFRTTIIRALEAPIKKDFDRITASLPDQRARIQHALTDTPQLACACPSAAGASRKICKRSGKALTNIFRRPATRSISSSNCG